jgi:hypothetical protein
MVTGLRGCATAGADSAEPTLPDSTAVLAVLPLNHRQHVAQHSVNRFDGSGARAARRARSGSGRDLCEKKPREEGGARFGGNVVKRRQSTARAMIYPPGGLVPPEILKSRRAQRRVARGGRDGNVAEPVLNRPGIASARCIFAGTTDDGRGMRALHRHKRKLALRRT